MLLAAIKVTHKLRALPPLSLAVTKGAINWMVHGRFEIKYCAQTLGFLSSTIDHKGGIAAFAEKRKPVFRGK